MSPLVKSALIIAAALLIAVVLWIYFSPYWSCVRSIDQRNEAMVCAKLAGR